MSDPFDNDTPIDFFDRPALTYSDGTARYDLTTFTLYTAPAETKHAGVIAALHEMTHWTQQIGTNALGFVTACACLREIICIEMFNDFQDMPYSTSNGRHSLSMPTGVRFFLDDFGFCDPNNTLLAAQKEWRDLFLAEKYVLKHLQLPPQSTLPSDLRVYPSSADQFEIVRDAYPEICSVDDPVVDPDASHSDDVPFTQIDIQGNDLIEAMTLVIEFNVARISVDHVDLTDRWNRLKETSYSKVISKILDSLGSGSGVDDVLNNASIILHICDISLATALPPFDNTNPRSMGLLETLPGAEFGSVVEALRQFNGLFPRAGLEEDDIRRKLHDYLSKSFEIKTQYSGIYLNSDKANFLLKEMNSADKELEDYDVDTSKGPQFNLYFKYCGKIDRVEFLCLVRSLFLAALKLNNTSPLWQLWLNPRSEVMAKFGFPPVFNHGPFLSKEGFTRKIRDWLFKAGLVSYPLSDIALGRSSGLYPLVNKITSIDIDPVSAEKDVAIILRRWLARLLKTNDENISLL